MADPLVEPGDRLVFLYDEDDGRFEYERTVRTVGWSKHCGAFIIATDGEEYHLSDLIGWAAHSAARGGEADA